MNILISRENSQFSRKIKTFISRFFCHLTNFFQHHLRRCFCHAKKEIMTALIMYTIHSVPEPMMMEWVSFKLLDTLTPTLSGRRKIWKSKRDYWSKPFEDESSSSISTKKINWGGGGLGRGGCPIAWFRRLSDDDFSVAEAVITAARTGKKFPLPRIDLEFTISHKKNSRISQCTY